MSYKSVNLNDYEVVNNAGAFIKAQMPGAIELSKQKLELARRYVEEGDWTLKLAGLAAGIAISVTSSLAFLSDLFGFAPFYSVLDLYLFVFGIVMIALEYKEKILPVMYLQALRREALFLYKPVGRAAFYFFAGVLLVAKGGLFGWLAGLFSMAVGGFSFYSTRGAMAAFETLKQQKLADADVVKKFHDADTNGDGRLDLEEVRVLCESLGHKLNRFELESAFFALDQDGGGDVSLEEFQYWFSNRSEV